MIVNKYCSRCKSTTHFDVNGTVYTCPQCGMVSDISIRPASLRVMIGDPFAKYRSEVVDTTVDNSTKNK